MAFLAPFRRLPGAALVFSLILGLGTARAQAFSFSDGLSADERAACGLAKLSPAQIGALNAYVARDVSLAHEGGVTGFSSAFSVRLNPQQKTLCGIDRLSEKERGFLDAMAARSIAYGPPPSQEFSYRPAAAAAPPPPEEVVAPPPAVQVHGDVSFTIGGGHGSSYYGSSMDLFVTDPSGKYTIGVGVSEFRGHGFFGPYGPYCLDPLLP